ncbi:MAG: threonine/serine transporter TdcC [Enterobacter mori]|nr:threonine/serine transporter TdcC [Enterobacter mori]
MSNTESIIVGQTKTSSWRKSDTTWTLGLFGTAIGAGVLFFPIRAGFGGLSSRLRSTATGRWRACVCQAVTSRATSPKR